MKSALSLRELTPPFIKLLGSAALSVAAGSAATENTYLHDLLAVDKKMAVPLLNTLSSFWVNKTFDEYKDLIRPKDFGFDGELLKAYQAALNLTFHKLQERCIQKYPEISPETVKEFFIDLDYNYFHLQEHDNDTVTQRIIKAYVDTNDSFFSTVLNILQLSKTSSEGKLLQFVAEEFSNELGLAFSKQLLKTEHQKARMGFMIYLSKENLRISNASQDTLQKVSQLLEGIANNQQLGNHIQEEALRVQKLASENLRQMGYALERIEGGVDQVVKQTAVKLPLSLPNIRVGIDRKNIFQFKAAYTTFIGRKKEIQQLDEFVQVDNEFPVRWLMVTGPGGSGKSRLALEYCQKIRQQGFDAGFLTAENLYRLQDYKPEKPTLIVIDYVAAQSKRVSSVIVDLYRRRTTNNPLPRNKNLRLLLLERNISYDTFSNNGNWWKDFKENAEVWSCGFLLNEHNQPILSLSGFNNDKLWQIIEEVYQKSKSETIPYDREEILTQLYRLDPRKRPLFAFFVGVALADGNFGNLRAWNVHNLLNSLLAREKKEFWQPHESYERKEPKLHENLLAIVTLTQVLLQDTVSELCESIANDGKWLPSEPDIELYNSMAQIRNDEQTEEIVWEGLQPDLLGEYFVLTRIENWLLSINKSKAEKEVIALIQSAWNTSPERVKDFIDRTLRDYTELANTKAYQILLTTPPSTKARKEVWNARGLFLLNTTVRPFTSTGELANPLKYYEILFNETALPQDDANKDLLILKQAEATFNMTTIFSSKGDIKQAEVYYKKIEGLYSKYKTPDIALLQAQAANNLVFFFSSLRRLEKAEEYYNDIAALLKAFKTPDIALAQAKAITNITGHFGHIEDSDHIKKYYEKISDSLDKFAIPEIALEKAKAAGHLITHSKDKTTFKYAELLYNDIETLFSVYKLTEIRILQIRAAYSLANRTGRKEEFEKAEWYFAQGKALSKDLTTALTIFVHTNAAFNLTLYFANAGSLDKVEQYYKELLDLNNKYESIETMISVAKAAVFLCLKSTQFAQPDHAVTYFETIEKLMSKHRNGDIIRTLVNYTIKCSKIFTKDGWLVLAKASQQSVLFYSNKIFNLISHGI